MATRGLVEALVRAVWAAREVHSREMTVGAATVSSGTPVADRDSAAAQPKAPGLVLGLAVARWMLVPISATTAVLGRPTTVGRCIAKPLRSSAGAAEARL